MVINQCWDINGMYNYIYIYVYMYVLCMYTVYIYEVVSQLEKPATLANQSLEHNLAKQIVVIATEICCLYW